MNSSSNMTRTKGFVPVFFILKYIIFIIVEEQFWTRDGAYYLRLFKY